MGDYHQFISFLKKENGKKEYILFTDLLEKYNAGLKNAHEFYLISFSILLDDYNIIKSNSENLNKIKKYKKRWNEINSFLDKLFVFIDDKYLILKRFKMFSKMIDIDELVDYQKKEWDLRRNDLMSIKY